MWTNILKIAVLALMAGNMAGCGGSSEAKTQTKALETLIKAEDWKGAAGLMDSSFVWTQHNGSVVEPPVDARIKWLKNMKTTGTQVTFRIEDSTTPSKDIVVVKTNIQVRTGDSTKPANTFLTCSIRWKKIKDKWMIVAIKDLTPPEQKTGA